jgi:hypothetical protein
MRTTMSSSLSPSLAGGQHHLKLVPERAGLGEYLTLAWPPCAGGLGLLREKDVLAALCGFS